MAEHPKIIPAQPRKSVHVEFPDGRIFQGAVGTALEAFIQEAYPEADPPIVAAFVNDEIRELAFAIETDAKVRPLDITTGDGSRIYQRSLSFLLVIAAWELFPKARVIIDHSLTMNGLYCEVQGREPFSKEEVARLEKRMREIADEDAPIVKERIPLQQAKAMFQKQGYDDKVRLLEYRNKEHLDVYSLHGIRNYFYGYMVPSTRYVSHFALHHYPPGLILRFPRRSNPQKLPAFRDSPKLAAVFREYKHNLQLMDIENVGGLNQAIAQGRTRELILVNEALHEEHLSQIAKSIAEQKGQTRLVLLAGPTASGKTTSTKRLAVLLLAQGIRPVVLGLDDYFLDRELTPKDEHGHYMFEDLVAIDLELFNQQLLDLMDGRPVTLARFDFRSGTRRWGDRVQIGEDQMILVEGIHGMNPNLVPDIPPEVIYRVYVSCLTQVNIDHHNRVPTTDTRLLRRLVRDARYRGYSAADTIRQWEHVRSGEERNIFPYQENADAMFNSALAYELAVLKPFAEPLLREIEHGSLEYAEAKRLLNFLTWLLPCESELIPDNSLLREFIGGSILRDFEPWRYGLRPEAREEQS